MSDNLSRTAQDLLALSITQTNLVSDGFVEANHIDPNLVNPWGVSYNPTGPFWVSDNGTGVATLYNGSGEPSPVGNPLVVTIPTPDAQADHSAPTGQVFNGGGGFVVTEGYSSGSAAFLFATEDGTIAGWNPTVDATNAITAVDESGSGAVFKGLAIGTMGGQQFLYAANFHDGNVEVFDSSFNHVKSFTDPSVPSNYAPFNVQVLGDHLYVTFAQQDETKHDDVPGPGHGYVDEFDLSGQLLHQVAANGPLDSPWGLDIAPASFGRFAGDLLVGNFGDGTINVFDHDTGDFAGKLTGPNGQPIQNDGLWALINGNGGNGGEPNTVYFTAGLADETHGLFGSLTPTTADHPWS